MFSQRALALQLNNVSYTYPHSNKVALSEITYTFSPGTTAIVGPNGAGKSTLVKLLTGLLVPTSGLITACQLDGTSLPPEKLEKAVLFQEPSHLYLTIRQNVTMRFEKTPGEDERIYDALNKAGLGKVVRGLADGIDTLVGAGFGGQTDLSGGQWQRLALARLIYQDAPVIILDEPVASLDPQGERVVFELFAKMAGSKIIIFTTHRYDSIPKNTKIVVLVDGVIAENGTHDELIQKQRDYWSLYISEASNKSIPLLVGQPGHTDHSSYASNGNKDYRLADVSLRFEQPACESSALASLPDEADQHIAQAVSDGPVFEMSKSDSPGQAIVKDHDAPVSPQVGPTSLELHHGKPVARRSQYFVLFSVLVVLLLMAAMGTGFLLHSREYRTTSSATPGSISRSIPSGTVPATRIPGAFLYPSLAASYAGTIADLMTQEKTTLLLTSVQQNLAGIQGYFQGLGLAGPFKGTVTPPGQVQFSVTLYAGEQTLVFVGTIKVGGDIVGTFTVLNQHGQRTGESGLWNMAATA